MAITLYGIPNCDTVKKARTWLEDQEIAYTFHNFKKDGVSPELINIWLADIAWDVLVNRKGTIWRTLSDHRRASVTDGSSATPLMIEFPSVIKRPVLFTGKNTYVGFSDALYQQIFNQ
ncbi:ArsC family reductase [Glaciimonas immobilis]|uniref:Arsenate reductase n=1 Tax=Glaciimonas immobilis TaxID=728004 RepID=A0A840RLM7_9BURK|nr:ArsC family reductase [Glaciimonas immobilis]KAF3999118.1 ArsC family reductase [Glaciimonas immobilis]MBB5198555.1 arsenate reductase [Glaciimonas immobilis]